MEQVPVELARWAVDAGLGVVAEATAALDDGADPLTVGTALRRSHPPARAAFAVSAAVARRAARAVGMEHADQLVLTREAVEQASRPPVAAWRAARAVAVHGAAGTTPPVVDLCAGLGSDTVALARSAGAVVAVERDAGRAVLLAHRARVLGLDVDVVVGDALAPPVVLTGRTVHADPDRRDAHGRRARDLRSHGPPVDELVAVTRTRGATAQLVTVAPGTSWADPALPADGCLTFVEHDGALVEAVLEVDAAATARARAVRLPGGHVLERTGPVERLPTGEIGRYLLLPAAALVRARLHDDRGAAAGARRLARRRALLTADDPPDDQWLRSEEVLAVLAPRPRALRQWLRGPEGRATDAQDGGVTLLTHGIDADPTSFLRAAAATTGPHGVRVHLVRRDADAVAIVTREHRDDAPGGRTDGVGG